MAPSHRPIDDDGWSEDDAGYRSLRPYYRIDTILHDPDGHPVCTWCIKPLDEEIDIACFGRPFSVYVARKGKYHVHCYQDHVYQPKGGVL